MNKYIIQNNIKEIEPLQIENKSDHPIPKIHKVSVFWSTNQNTNNSKDIKDGKEFSIKYIEEYHTLQEIRNKLNQNVENGNI